MQYSYEHLNPDRFQELCQAILVREYRHVQCFPIGQRDGGRDALVVLESGERVVFQIKFKRERLKNDDPYTHIKKCIDSEKSNIARLASEGFERYVLMTNLGGSSARSVGAMDRAQCYLNEILPETMNGQIWWRADLDARLNNLSDLKWNFVEILSGRDMFQYLVTESNADTESRRYQAVKGYLEEQHKDDKDIKFKQADLQSTDLISLFIDVPVRPQESSSHYEALDEVSLQEEIDSRSLVNRRHFLADRNQAYGGAAFILHTAKFATMTRIVVEGGPGQGKSTLAQFICQIQRMRLLGDDKGLSRVDQIYRSAPARVPFKVDLRDLSSWFQRRDPFSGAPLPDDIVLSLETFLAAQVHRLSGGRSFSVDDLHEFFSKTPSLIVLDGLDEVASHADRKIIVDAVDAASSRIASSSPLTQIVVSSRPAAIASTPRLQPDPWRYYTLSSIDESLVHDYANRWAKAKKLRADEISEIQRTIAAKLSSAHVRDLAHNAMQLTILLNLVHTHGQGLPDHRTELYRNYINIYFNREAAKNRIVRENRQLLIDLHGYLGWMIHASAESERSDGRVTGARLRELIATFLDGREHKRDSVAQLLDGVVHRIVMIVSNVQDTFEFEVQPLREYFAGYHLYHTSPYSPSGRPKSGTKPEIFQAVSRNPFWFNVTRFYAGFYSVGEIAGLADQIEENVTVGAGAGTSFPRMVASALMQDRVFDQAPRVARRITIATADNLALRYATNPRRGLGGVTPIPRREGDRDYIANLIINRALSAVSAAAQEEYSELLGYLSTSDGTIAASEWLKARPEFDLDSSSALAKWLKIGACAGVLGALAAEDAVTLAELGEEFKNLLLAGGHAALLGSSEAQLDAVIRFSNGQLPVYWRKSILNPVFSRLNQSRAIIRTPSRRRSFVPGAKGGDLSQGLCPEIASMVAHISGCLLPEWSEPEPADTEALESVLGALESTLGETWLSWELAIVGLLRRRPKSIPLRSSQYPVQFCLEVRKHKSDAEWWRHMKSELEGDPVRIAGWLYAYFMCAPECVIRESVDDARVIERVTDSILDRILIEIQMVSTSRFRELPVSLANDLLRADDLRLKIAFASRTRPEARARIAMAIAESEKKLEGALADWCMRMILMGDSRKVMEYNADLIEIVKKVYLAAPRSTVRYYPPGEIILPGSVRLAEEIIQVPDLYPPVLVAGADVVLSEHYQRQLPSVSSIASNDGWAANI
ncbi:NACHT domain-containing NTPase [Nocardia sp. JCM 34519]|uniref:NACHT domain-containing protein n=1 Tax=Nocardia sp. JCM 34519 TaxID=2876118 RepID=UPI001CE3C228|nr:hypothetical protein [Nocardia sp. JCM 34519]